MAKRKYKKKKMKALDWAAIVLLIAGGINWGLVAILNFDLVSWATSFMPVIGTAIKGLVGFAAVYSIFSFLKY